MLSIIIMLQTKSLLKVAAALTARVVRNWVSEGSMIGLYHLSFFVSLFPPLPFSHFPTNLLPFHPQTGKPKSKSVYLLVKSSASLQTSLHMSF